MKVLHRRAVRDRRRWLPFQGQGLILAATGVVTIRYSSLSWTRAGPLPGANGRSVAHRALAGGQERTEGPGDPALVAVGGPAPLDGEDPVHLG